MENAHIHTPTAKHSPTLLVFSLLSFPFSFHLKSRRHEFQVVMSEMSLLFFLFRCHLCCSDLIFSIFDFVLFYVTLPGNYLSIKQQCALD